MDYVLVRYGNMTASDLFLETCKKDSLWYRAAVRTGLLETFNRQECNNSDLQINFAEVMSDSSAEVYCESLNIRQTANLLNVEFMFEGVPVSRGVWYDLNEITNCYWQVEVSC